jgi:hypothetical protein
MKKKEGADVLTVLGCSPPAPHQIAAAVILVTMAAKSRKTIHAVPYCWLQDAGTFLSGAITRTSSVSRGTTLSWQPNITVNKPHKPAAQVLHASVLSNAVQTLD